jgi:prostaglandin-H2 D-isomerase / glutathione transferase
MSSMEFKYFDFAGRAESARILLHAAKADWKDVRLDSTAWGAFKPTAPLGQIPTLSVNGVEFCQSVAIVRYAAKLADLYPKDAFHALIVDEALDAMNECIAKIPFPGEQDARKAFQQDIMSKYFGLVESRIQKFGGDNKDTVCGVFSAADIDLMNWVHFVQSGFFDHIDTDFFKAYPGILACVDQTAKQPQVVSYYASLGAK